MIPLCTGRYLFLLLSPLLLSVQYLEGPVYAGLAQVPGLVPRVLAHLPQQTRHVHVLVVVKVTKPPGK